MSTSEPIEDAVLRPVDEAGVVEAVRWAMETGSPLDVRGHGSKAGLGRATQTRATLDMSRLSGVTLYEPEELVLSARAGTPIAEIEELLAANGQEMQFEPMDYGPLHGGERGRGTIGGVIACNLSGPRRLKAGAARDHVLGVRVVTGRGEAIKSGGRVVKNVTGYDLSKGVTGAYGTLGVLTEVTIKVLPKAESETTLVLRGLDAEGATAAMASAMGSSAEVSGAAFLPDDLIERVGGGISGSASAVLLRVEGFPTSIAYRTETLETLLGGKIERIEGEASHALWRGVRDAAPFADETMQPVWRVSVAPTQGWHVARALKDVADSFLDWQGGLVWLRMKGDAEASRLRKTVAKCGGGHATLVRADTATRASVPVFEPQSAPLATLSARLKTQFDPQGILNPGRMVAGS